MPLNPPAAVRAVLYIITALGTPIVAYLNAKGYVGSLEVGLWSAEVAVVSLMAGLNTGSSDEPPAPPAPPA
jgi:hypothetical protein